MASFSFGQANDKIVRALHRSLICPVTTRWHSKHDSLKLFLDLYDKHSLAMKYLFADLNVAALNKVELRVLKDYVQVCSSGAVSYTHLTLPTILLV